MAGTYFQRMIFILFLSCLFPAGIGATPLGSVTMSYSCNALWNLGPYGNDESVLFCMGITDDDIRNQIDQPEGLSGWWPGDAFLFFTDHFTLADAGLTFEINQSNYVFWNSMVNSVLTDGDQDMFYWTLAIEDTGNFLGWNFSPYYSGNGIDFQEYNINHLSITINDIQVQEPLPENYSWTVNWTLTVDGQSAPIPEPATMLLLCTGMAGLVGVRFRKKKL